MSLCPNPNSPEFITLSQVSDSFPYDIWLRYNQSLPSLAVCEALVNLELRKNISNFRVDLGNNKSVTLGPTEMQMILSTTTRAVTDELLKLTSDEITPQRITEIYNQLQERFKNNEFGGWMRVIANANNFTDFVKISKKALGKYQLVIEEEAEENEEGRVKDTLDAKPMVYFSTRTGSAPEIRMIVGTTGAPTTVERNGQVMLKSVTSGLEGRIWNKLLNMLADKDSPGEMLETIRNEITKGTPDAGWLTDLYKRLTDIPELDRRIDLQTKFYQSFNNYSYGVERTAYDTELGTVRTYNENKRNVVLPAKEEVVAGVASAMLQINEGTQFNNSTNIVPANINAKGKEYRETEAYRNAKTIHQKAKLKLAFLGIPFPEAVLNIDEGTTNEAAGLIDVVSTLSGPANDIFNIPYALLSPSQRKMYQISIRSLNQLIEWYGEMMPNSSEISLKNSEGSMIFPISRRNGLTRLLKRIRNLPFEQSYKGAWKEFNFLRAIREGATVSFIDGLNEFGKNKDGQLTSSTSIRDYLSILISGMFNYSQKDKALITILPTGDKSLEYALKVDKDSLLYEDLDTIDYKNERYTPSLQTQLGWISLLEYELERIHDANKGLFNKIQYWNTQAKEFQIFSFLNDDTKQQLLKQTEVQSQYRKKGEDLWKMIGAETTKFMNQEIKQMISLVKAESPMTSTGEAMIISNELITQLRSKNPSENATNKIVAAYTANQMLFGAEQTIVLFGDISSYKKTVSDFFKRTQAIVGTGKGFRTDQEMNAYIANNVLVDTNFPTDGTFRVSVVDDILVATNTAKAFKEKAYDETNEADAQGWISFDSYIDAMVRAGEFSWTAVKPVVQKIKEGVLLTEDDLKSVKYFPPLKLQYSGFKPAIDGKNVAEAAVKSKYAVQEYLKLSLLPLLPTATKDYQIDGMREAMESQGISIVVVESGSKVGSEGIKPLYTNTGELETDYNYSVLDYNDLIIQVDNKPKTAKRILFGTQVRKLIFSNLLGPYAVQELGQEKAEKMSNLFTEYNSILQELIDREFNKLVKDLGVKEENGQYIVTPEAYIELLKKIQTEMIDREMPDNMIDAADFMMINHAKYNVVFDAFPDKNKVENLLCALISNRIVKQEMPGKQLVQAAATGWQPKQKGDKPYKRFEKKRDKAWIADGAGELGFIKDENGKITSVDVLLPSEYKNILNIDETVKELLAYRIPTEGYNSIVKINVKGYLPPEMGGAIIVPSDITVQAGSDFDIDKLYVFMPHTYKSGKKVKTVKYFQTGEEAYDYLYQRKLDLLRDMDRAIAEEQIRLEDALDSNDAYTNLVVAIWNQVGPQGFTEEEVDEILKEAKFEGIKKYKQLEKLIETFPSKEEFIKNFTPTTGNSKQALENRIIDIMREVMSEKYVAEQAVSPLSADVIKDYKTKVVDKAIPSTSGKSSWQIISPAYQAITRKIFLEAKKGVGGAAIHNAHHTLTQAANTAYKLSEAQVSYFFNRTGMKANTTDEGVSLAGIKDQSGRFINKILSALLNSFVDAAKDPYIEQLNFNFYTSNAAYFLIRSGVDVENVLALLNQPAIREYAKRSKNRKSIINTFEGRKDPLPALIEEYAKAANVKLQDFKRIAYSRETLEANFNTNNPALQLTVLLDFNDFNSMGKDLMKLIAASSYDRTQPKTIGESMVMLSKEEEVREADAFTNINQLIGIPFMQTFRDKGAKMNVELFSQVFISQYPTVKSMMNYVLSQSMIESEEAVNKFSNFLLTYLVQNYMRKNYPLIDFTNFEQVQTLFSGDVMQDYSIGNLLYQLKNTPAYNSELVRTFLNINPETNKLPFATIRYYNKKLDKLGANQLTSDFRRIYDLNRSVAETLHLITVLQNGIGEGFDSYLKIVPYEQHIPVFAEALRSELAQLDPDSVLDSFYLNHVFIDSLVPFFRKADVIDRTASALVLSTGDGAKFSIPPRFLKTTEKGVNIVYRLQMEDTGSNKAHYVRVQERGITGSGKHIIEANSSPYIKADGTKTWTLHPNRLVLAEFGLATIDMERLTPTEEDSELPAQLPTATVVTPTVTPKIEVISENYSSELLKANPNKLFLFGDNNQRTGKGGQAIIRDEPNAMGISTKLKPSNASDAFMSDNQLAENKAVIDSDIKKIKERAAKENMTIVLPKGGFGTGLAALATKAPETFVYLNQRLQKEFGFNNTTGEITPTITTDTVILNSPEFAAFAKEELSKNPTQSIESILEYYKKCKQ